MNLLIGMNSSKNQNVDCAIYKIQGMFCIYPAVRRRKEELVIVLRDVSLGI